MSRDGCVATKDGFQVVKLQRPARAAVCSHSGKDMAARNLSNSP